VRIFLSYGHDDYASLAVRLKGDLKALGHGVWFDVERLKPGGDWEQYIEEGFQFASEQIESGRFLLLMTPHSVRRPDPATTRSTQEFGYCLNELARAYSRNLPIIPVMVSTVEPPLSICRLEWLDMRQCFPVERHEEQYAKQFEKLVGALTEKMVPFEGVHQRLLNYLNPATSDDDLGRHTARFTGREWVMGEVDRWLDSSRRVLWITGEAGVGKSALAAWLCDKRPEISAYHFCRFGNSDRVDARKALFSLAYQLSTQVPAYQDRLNASQLDKIVVETNLPAVFDRLFVNLLTDTVSLTDRTHILLIDALDEATRDGRNELASLIGADFDRLPSWLRVIVTSRPHEQETNFALQALDPWKLDAARPENFDDMRKYLRLQLKPFTDDGEPSEQLVNAVMEKSEGLFLYVSWVRQELEDGRLSLTQIEEFPRGLGGLYRQFFQRYFPDIRDYGTDCRPALEAICAAREPLEWRSLALLLGRSEYEMRLLIARLGSLFPPVDDRVRPFHQSVRDWLIDPERAGPYWIDISAQEQRLADLAWREYQAGVNTMGRYYIKHAASHLAACQMKAELRLLLLDPDWMQAKLQASGVVELLADYDLALKLTRPGRREETGVRDPTIRLLGNALRKSAHILARDVGQVREQLFGRLRRGMSPELDELSERIRRDPARRKLRARFASLDPVDSPLIQTLSGHKADINGVLLLPGGSQVLSWSEDRTLRVWNLETGKQIGEPLAGHKKGITGARLLRGGSQVLSWSHDSTLRVWDLGTGRQIGEPLAGHEDGIAGALLLDGNRALSWGDGTARLWNLETGHKIRMPPAGGLVVGMTSLDSGQVLAWGREGWSIAVWDPETGDQFGRLPRDHDVVAIGVLLLPDGKRALSWGTDFKIRRWDLEKSAQIGKPLTGHEGWVGGALLLPDGKRVLSWSMDGTLRQWDLQTGKQVGKSLAHDEGFPTGVLLMPDGKRALSWSSDAMRLWDLETGQQLGKSLGTHEDVIHGVLVLPDGERVLSWQGRTLQLWDVESVWAAGVPAPGESDVVSVEGALLLPDDKRLLSWSSGETLLLWDLDEGQQIGKLAGHKNDVNGALLLPGGQRALSWGTDGTLRRWDLNTCRQVGKPLAGHKGVVYRVLLLPGGKQALSWSEDSTLRVWDLESGRQIGQPLAGHEADVNGALLLPGGRQALSWSHDRTLRMWNLKTGKQVGKPLIGHEDHRDDKDREDHIIGALVLPGGKRALSWAEDRTLRLWDLKTCDQVGPAFIGHDDSVYSAQLLPDERRVLSWGGDGTLRIWDLETGQQVGEPVIRRENDVNGAELLPDKRRVLSFGEDGTLRIWELETGKQVGQSFVGHEGDIKGIELLADRNKALSWGEDETLRLWDLATSEELERFYTDGPIVSLVDCRTRGFFVTTHGGRVHFLESRVDASRDQVRF